MSRSADKERSLLRILDAAARRLREEGLTGAAIASVMHDAGLTHGAFYSHFGSKEQLSVAAFRHALITGRAAWIGVKKDRSWVARVRRLAQHYLNPLHRDDRTGGCPFAAVGADASRAPESFRAGYQEELVKSLDAIAGGASCVSTRFEDAIAMIAICLGGLTLARSVADRDLSDRILKVCRRAAIGLAESAET